MGLRKNKTKSVTSNNVTDSEELDKALEHLLENSPDSILVFDLEGKIIASNNAAANALGTTPIKLVNQYLWQQLKLNTTERKRQFIRARKKFVLAKAGIAQQYTWIETAATKPIAAYTIMINKTEIHGTPLLFVELNDVLQTKIIEWVLWSLAKIHSHHEINEVINEILKLISDVYDADVASVSLLDTNGAARTVCYYEFGKHRENITYPLNDSPDNDVIKKQSILYFNDLPHQYPKAQLPLSLGLNTYLGGPIINAENKIVGLLTVLRKQSIDQKLLDTPLFHILLKRIRLEVERLLSERKLEFLASISKQDPNPIIRILPSGEVIFANTQGKKILQFWESLEIGIPERLLNEAQIAEATGQVIRVELEADHKTYLFTLIWINEFKQINIYGTDISQLKNTEKNMLNLARFDSLTQIANRQYFEEKLVEKIHEHSVEGNSLALLLIDFDNFKMINDTLGHPIGDRLLKAATNRMVRCIRQDDFIARLGGDEFIVLLHNTNTNGAILVAEKIISVLARAFQFGEYHMNITASIGIALCPETGKTPSDLLKHADIAMYQAKRAGKNNYAVFSKSLHYVQDKRNEVIKTELKFAAAKNELYIDYQPQIEVATNKIVGFEALLRWNHPEEGLILPTEFIPIAEQTGCIHLISQWLIEQSLQDYNAVLKPGFKPILSLNVSLSQLNDPRFIDSLIDNLQQNNVEKEQIVLDISERTIASHFKQISKILKKIHLVGIKICLDNFGSPQISLPKLLTMPFDYFKLDQQLLVGVEKQEKQKKLLKGIIHLTQELNLEVVQKGVETEEHHNILKAIGCHYAQGYFYCKPVRIDKLIAYIKNNT